MAIHVNTTPVKMVNDHFLHLVPVKEQIIDAGATFHVKNDRFGMMGEAQCSLVYQCRLMDIKSAVELMEGNQLYVSTMRNAGYHAQDIIQVCFFRFLQRNEVSFRAMLDAEYKRMNLIIHRQKELFS